MLKEGQQFNPKGMFHSSIFIPEYMLSNPDLSLYDKVVWAKLVNYYNDKLGYAWPTKQTLANDLAICLSQVEKSIRKLVKEKLIRIVTPKGIQKMEHKPNKYFFIWSTIFELEKKRGVGEDTIQDKINRVTQFKETPDFEVDVENFMEH